MAPLNSDVNEWLNELEPEARHIAEAAEGYHMIGMYQETLIELNKLDPKTASHPKILNLLSRAHWGLRNINEAQASIDLFLQTAPQSPFGYVFKAMLLNYQNRHTEAYGLLRSAIGNFPGHATMAYDLATTAASCGMWGEARHWLYSAICIREDFRDIALLSTILAPIKTDIEAMRPQN